MQLMVAKGETSKKAYATHCNYYQWGIRLVYATHFALQYSKHHNMEAPPCVCPAFWGPGVPVTTLDSDRGFPGSIPARGHHVGH